MQSSIFDIDGTLVESVRADSEIYAASIEAVLGSIRFRVGWEEYEFVTDGGILFEVLDDNSIAHENALTDSIRREFLMRMEAHISEHGPFSEDPSNNNVRIRRMSASRPFSALRFLSCRVI